MEKKSFFENISELKENIEQYLETKLSLITLIAFHKAVKALTIIISSSISLLFLLTAFVFISTAAAIYLGKSLGSFELGLLLIAGIYLLLGIVFLLLRKPLFSRIVIQFLSTVFFKEDEDEILDDKNLK